MSGKNIKSLIICFCLLMFPAQLKAFPLPTMDWSRIAQVLVKTSNQIIINKNKIDSNILQALRNTEIGTGLDSWSKYSQILEDGMNEYNRYGDLKKAILASVTKSGQEFISQYQKKKANKKKAQEEAEINAHKRLMEKFAADKAADDALNRSIEESRKAQEQRFNSWYNMHNPTVGGTIIPSNTGNQ